MSVATDERDTGVFVNKALNDIYAVVCGSIIYYKHLFGSKRLPHNCLKGVWKEVGLVAVGHDHRQIFMVSRKIFEWWAVVLQGDIKEMIV